MSNQSQQNAIQASSEQVKDGNNVKTISCHLKLTPKADQRLVKIQYLLREENIKISKADAINLLLENVDIDDIHKILSDLLADDINKKIAKVFLNSDLNDRDMEIIKAMGKNKLKKT
ncbi:TPA: hypothetical protein ACTYZB_004810 [Klebsiella variicola]